MSNPVEIVAKAFFESRGPVKPWDSWDSLPEMMKQSWEPTALAVIAALEKEGYKVTKRAATKAMVNARCQKDIEYGDDERKIWRIMHDAAPRYGEPS